jgi:hypothetical protein
MEKKYVIIVHTRNKSYSNVILCNEKEVEEKYHNWKQIADEQDPNLEYYNPTEQKVVLNKNRPSYIVSVELAELKTLDVHKDKNK